MTTKPDGITGKTYFECNKPVVVLARWSGNPATPWTGIPLVWYPRSDGKPHPSRTGPHNVLIERADGSRVVRTFRGLRKEPKN